MMLRRFAVFGLILVYGCNGTHATQEDLRAIEEASAGQAGASPTEPVEPQAGAPTASAGSANVDAAGAAGASEVGSAGAPDEGIAGASGGASAGSGGSTSTAGGPSAAGGASAGSGGAAAGSGGSTTYDPQCAPSNAHPMPAKCAPQPIDCTRRVLNFGESPSSTPGPDPSNGYCTGGFGACPADPNATEPQVCIDNYTELDFALCSDGRMKSCNKGTCGGAGCIAYESDGKFCPCVVMGMHVPASK